MIRRALLTLLLAVASLAFVVAPAHADTKEDMRAEYKRAQVLFEEQQYAEALPMFERVRQMLDSPNAALYVGRCLHALGRNTEAFGAMAIAIDMAGRRAQTEARYAQTRDAATAEQALIAQKIGRVIINVPAGLAGLTVLLNGEPLEAASYGKMVAVEPGTVTVGATAEGHEVVEIDRAVAAGAVEVIAVALQPTGAKSDKPGPEPKPDAPAAGFGPLRIAGLAVAGVGVVGWVMFAVAGSMAKSTYDDTYDACGGTRCTDEYADDVSDGRTLTTVANVGLGIGIAGVAIGAGLFVLGTVTETSDSPVAAEASGDGFWLGYRGSF